MRFASFKSSDSQRLRLQRLLHLHENGQLINKPYVDLCNCMDRLIRNTAAQRFCDHPDPAVIDHFQLIASGSS